MRRSRIYIQQPITANSELIADSNVRHYLITVLRMKAGMEVEIFNGDGFDYQAEIHAIDKKSVTFSVKDSTPNRNESPLRITLLQGISKGDRMDIAIQKATELGVTEIIPVFTEFAAVKLQGDRQEKRVSHWQDIAINAAQQSERACVPTIQSCITLLEAAQQFADGDALKLMLHPYNAIPFTSQANETPKQVILIIGPEGGLSQVEVNQLQPMGYKAISLGKRILRTETATISAITLVQHTWGDLSY